MLEIVQAGFGAVGVDVVAEQGRGGDDIGCVADEGERRSGAEIVERDRRDLDRGQVGDRQPALGVVDLESEDVRGVRVLDQDGDEQGLAGIDDAVPIIISEQRRRARDGNSHLKSPEGNDPGPGRARAGLPCDLMAQKKCSA